MALLNRTLLLVGVTSLLTDISSEMVYPLLPAFVTVTLGAPMRTLGLIEGVAECLAQVLRVFAGAWSDRAGRRKPLAVAGYAGSALGKALLFLATSWAWVFAGRVIDRLGKGIRSAPRDALIAECVAPALRGRAFGLHRAMDTLGAVVGIVIAYAVFVNADDGIKTVLLVSLIPALLGVAALLCVREPARPAGWVRPERPPLKPAATWRSLPRRLKVFLAIVCLFTIGNSSNQFLMLRAGERGFDESRVILLYLVYTIVYMAASYPAGALSDRVGRKAVLVAGYAVHGLAYAGFALVDRLAGAPAEIAVWALFAVYGLHIGLTDGVEKALLVDLAPESIRATVLGLNATLIGLALLPASLLAGVLWDLVGPAAPFYVGAALGLSAAAALWRML